MRKNQIQLSHRLVYKLPLVIVLSIICMLLGYLTYCIVDNNDYENRCMKAGGIVNAFSGSKACVKAPPNVILIPR